MIKHVVVYTHKVGTRIWKSTTVLWAKNPEDAKETARKGAAAKGLVNFKVERVNTIWEG
jgi:hypothetical protein